MLIFLFAAASWMLPEAKWSVLADRLARRRIAKREPLSADERAMIEIVVGDRPRGWIEEHYWPGVLAHKYLSWMQILACHGPRRWRPISRLIGKEHVDRALEGGRGVMLFTATFAYKDLMAKVAFANAGYEVNHLSKDTHGFSETRFGKRWLNPIYTSIEERYLAERMVFSGSDTKAASARLRERLKQNAPVMVTVTPLGRHVASRPFLDGCINIATGGLNFAFEHGTPVLPVFTLQRDDGSIDTVVGKPLERPEGADRARAIDAALDDYVPRLAEHVRNYPDQFSFPITDRSGKLLLSPAPSLAAEAIELQRQRPAA